MYTDNEYRISLDFGFSMGWHMNPRWDDILDDDDDDDNYIPVPSPEAIAQGGTICPIFSARQ